LLYKHLESQNEGGGNGRHRKRKEEMGPKKDVGQAAQGHRDTAAAAVLPTEHHHCSLTVMSCDAGRRKEAVMKKERPGHTRERED
jgi:hypothetical protein